MPLISFAAPDNPDKATDKIIIPTAPKEVLKAGLTKSVRFFE
jgi:hypothetical protein